MTANYAQLINQARGHWLHGICSDDWVYDGYYTAMLERIAKSMILMLR